jgi:type IX secretion system PorP/SprF family membrane protein
MKKIYSIIIILIGFSLSIKSQDYAYYTQYMFNSFLINPAYAGSHDFINISGNIRKHWVGIEGAPSVQTFSAHSPFLRDQFGLGILVINDNIGITNQQEISANYSYKIKMRSFNMSLGLKMGFNSLSADFEQLHLEDELDENFQNEKTKLSPIIGFGAYIKARNYHIGLSIPQLYKFINTNYENSELNIHKLIFLNGGYIFKLNEDIKVKPHALAKVNVGSVFEMDLNANVYYKDMFSVGLSYKSLNSVSILFELGVKNSLFIGYSYDLATTRLIRHQSGTHEFSVNVFLNRKENTKIMNPRYF